MSKNQFKKQQPTFEMPSETVNEAKAMGEYIELCNGGKFDYNNPIWDIGAIAHSLSLLCRYTGHCRKFYSVAEHSVLVSRIMQASDLGSPMEGLLHDAVESVLADLARPIKALLPDYLAKEQELEASMRKSFGLPEVITAGCKEADWIALCLEARELLPTKGKEWYMPEGIRGKAAKLSFIPTGWTPDDAKSRFMMRMTEIRRASGLR